MTAEPCIDNISVVRGRLPVDCISADPSADRKFFIDRANCIDCGSCERECPNQAIFPAEELPGEWAAFARIDATWYLKPERVRDEINGYFPTAAA